MHAVDWCYEDVGSCEVQKVVRCDFLLPRNLIKTCMGVCVCVYVTIVARSNLCRNVVLRGCGKLRTSISYFLATRSLQMNIEAANDVGPKC